MSVSKRKLVVGAVVMVMLLGIVWLALRRRPTPTFSLADGTTIRLNGLSVGEMLHFHHGTRGQKILFEAVGANLPGRWVGTETILPATHTNGAIGISLSRFAKHGFLSEAWNGSLGLAMIDATGTETAGERKAVNFSAAIMSETTKITEEEIVWEFPLVTNAALQFRLYSTNATTGRVTTNQFAMDAIEL